MGDDMSELALQQSTAELLEKTGLRARRETVRADTFAARRAARGGGYRTPEWLTRSFVMPVQGSASSPSMPSPSPSPSSSPSVEPASRAAILLAPKLAERMAEVRRPAHAAPIDFAALVRRGETFRKARATALAAAALVVVLLGSFALTGIAALLPVLCVAAAGALGSTYVASRAVNAPLPRVRR